MLPSEYIFTSESVSEGHPDKLADQISDHILDELLAIDKNSRVAVETYVKNGMVLVGGEVTTSGWVDVEHAVRSVLKHTGYIHADMGIDYQSCAVLNTIGRQSADIAQGVDRSTDNELGAGDQGLMFGYASDETDVYMPMPITLAHKLMRRQAHCRQEGNLTYLRPDAKAQVSVRYTDGVPTGISKLVLSTQHDPDVDQKTLIEEVKEHIIKPSLPDGWFDDIEEIMINPTGRFVIGGPQADCGLTGRKLMVDTYGGFARHGGGAFSGKDPTKVDRSAAYMARYIAKNLVAAGLAKRCEVQLSYAIGLARPTSIMVHSFGTSHLSDTILTKLVTDNFDARPASMIKELSLLDTKYLPVSRYGHFGRDDLDLPWEKLNRVHDLTQDAQSL